jgi:hypothetical protein
VWAIAVAAITIVVAIVVVLVVRKRSARPAEAPSAAPEPIEEEVSGLVVELAEHAVPIAKDTVIASRYRVIGKLGADELGPAFEVARLSDGERFALRTVRRRGADRMARYAKEIAIASEIGHENLVPVLDQGVTGNELYLVMPLVRGGSLEQVRGRFGDPAWALPLLAQVASGLAALHERGVVHRGLQASNVLLAKGTARIADIALALIARKSVPLDGGDPRADIFAFGLLARDMLGKTEIPAWVTRCLDPEPAARPTAAELAQLLTAAKQ